MRTLARHRPGSGIGVIERCFPEPHSAQLTLASSAPSSPWRTTRSVVRARPSGAWRSLPCAGYARSLFFPSDPTSSPDRRSAGGVQPPREELQVAEERRPAAIARSLEGPARTCRRRRRVHAGPRSAASPRGPRTEASDRDVPRSPAVARGRPRSGPDGARGRRREHHRVDRDPVPAVPAPHPSEPSELRPDRPPRCRGAGRHLPRSTRRALHRRTIASALAECRDTLPPVVDPP